MRQSIEVRVRIPVADIVDAMADEVAREVERQVAPLFKLQIPAPPLAPAPRRPVLNIDDAVMDVIAAVTRLENSTHTRDEGQALSALKKAAIALRTARKQQFLKDKSNA